MTFGVLSALGASLTIASIAVLPVLIGLAVDYAIQLQSRIAEEAQPSRRRRRGSASSVAAAARRAALLGAPAVAVAAAATAAGFAVLALSPVPMVRGFGLLLVAGIAIAFALALLGGDGGARARRPRARARRPRPRGPSGEGGDSPCVRSIAASGESPPRASGRVRAATAAALAYATRAARAGARDRRAPLAACGWALDTQTRVESDIQRLVPQDMPALRDLDALQRSTGVGGEVDVVIEGADLTRPAVDRAGWSAFRRRSSRDQGYSAKRGCGEAALCPAFSLPDLFTTPASRATRPRSTRCSMPSRRTSRARSSRADRRTATLAFGIRLMPLDEQKRVIDAMRARLDDGRPPGVRGRARRPARARRRRERRRLVEPAPPAHAAGRPRRRRRSSCWSRSAATCAGRSSRSCRSRSRPAGRRSCCSRCGSR